MQIKLTTNEALRLKVLLDKMSESKLIKISPGLTSTTIDVKSEFVVDVLLALKNLSKEWAK